MKYYDEVGEECDESQAVLVEYDEYVYLITKLNKIEEELERSISDVTHSLSYLIDVNTKLEEMYRDI